MQTAKKYTAYFKYIFALLLFGSNGIVASFISLNSYEIVFLRTMTGSALLVAIFLLSKRQFTFQKHKRDTLFLAVSGMAMGASWMFLYEAYRQIGVSVASLAYYCGPVIVMALSPFIFREKLTIVKTAGFLVVMLGIFLVNGQAFGEKHNVWGIFFGAMSAVMYAFMVIFNKKAKRITGLENSALQLFVSFLTVAVFMGLRQDFSVNIEINDIIPILILGFLNTGTGCYFYFSSIGHLPIQTVAVCGYLEPLSAVIFSVLFLGENLLPLQIIGAVLIIGGAVFSEIIFSKN